MPPPVDILVGVGFYAFAAIALAGAMGVLLAQRIFRSALFLVLTLASVAAVFVVLGADFLAGAQVLLYVGAVMVLILFGIMLTPQEIDLPGMAGPGRTLAASLVAAGFFVAAVLVLTTTRWPGLAQPPADSPTTTAIGLGLFNVYVLPFEIASVLLLVAMIGAIVIAREE